MSIHSTSPGCELVVARRDREDGLARDAERTLGDRARHDLEHGVDGVRGRAQLGDRAQERAGELGRAACPAPRAAATTRIALFVDRLRAADALELVRGLRDLGGPRAPCSASTTGLDRATPATTGTARRRSRCRPTPSRSASSAAPAAVSTSIARWRYSSGSSRRRALGEVGVEVRPRVAPLEHRDRAPPGRAHVVGGRDARAGRVRDVLLTAQHERVDAGGRHRGVELRDRDHGACVRDRACRSVRSSGPGPNRARGARDVCRYTATRAMSPSRDVEHDGLVGIAGARRRRRRSRSARPRPGCRPRSCRRPPACSPRASR